MAGVKHPSMAALPFVLRFSASRIRFGHRLQVRMAFLIGALAAGALQGLALASYGPFQDSEIYYDLFREVAANGVWSSLSEYATQTGKFEPVAVLIFWLESLLLGTSGGPFAFLLLNMVLLNVLVAQTVARRLLPSGKPLAAFVVPLLCLSSYLVFSKQLYFWRSALSFCFLIHALGSVGGKRVFWICVAILAHYSAAAFLMLYVVVQLIERTRTPVLYHGLLTMFLILATVFTGELSLLTFFVSGGDLEVFLVPGEHGARLTIAIVACLVPALLSYKRASADADARPLVVFSLILLVVSLANFNNYHLMQRLSLPAFFIIPFLPFAYPWRGLRLLAARWAIALTVLPTARLFYMLATGEFTPA
jgi:hypothetical protein